MNAREMNTLYRNALWMVIDAEDGLITLVDDELDNRWHQLSRKERRKAKAERNRVWKTGALTYKPFAGAF